MENPDGWPVSGPEAFRCPKCSELHTAWVLNEQKQLMPDGAYKIVYRQCRYCEHGVDVWYEMGVGFTRAEDRAQAEGK